MVRPKTKISKVRMVGPLVPFTDDFTSTLKSSGYAPLTIVNELRLMAHLSRWMLVAVHPWDIDGASRAGLATAWVSRAGADYPGHFRPPTHTVRALPELAALLAG